MPRLSTIDYLRQRAALREEWFEHDAYAFVVLSPTEQFAIHDFSELTQDLSPVEILAHRKEITASRPGLPQQAGRAFARIRPFLNLTPVPQLARPVGERARHWSAAGRKVSVFSQVHPELDPNAFARIILDFAKHGPPPDMQSDGNTKR